MPLMDGNNKNGKTKPAKFIAKLYEMLQDSDNVPYISWGSDNSSVVILNPPSFSKEVLPKYYKHNNTCSFVRQLNTYGFRKVNNNNTTGEVDSNSDKLIFFHEKFRKDDPVSLLEIERRKTVKRNGEDKELEIEDDEEDSPTQHSFHTSPTLGFPTLNSRANKQRTQSSNSMATSPQFQQLETGTTSLETNFPTGQQHNTTYAIQQTQPSPNHTFSPAGYTSPSSVHQFAQYAMPYSHPSVAVTPTQFSLQQQQQQQQQQATAYPFSEGQNLENKEVELQLSSAAIYPVAPTSITTLSHPPQSPETSLREEQLMQELKKLTAQQYQTELLLRTLLLEVKELKEDQQALRRDHQTLLMERQQHQQQQHQQQQQQVQQQHQQMQQQQMQLQQHQLQQQQQQQLQQLQQQLASTASMSASPIKQETFEGTPAAISIPTEMTSRTYFFDNNKHPQAYQHQGVVSEFKAFPTHNNTTNNAKGTKAADGPLLSTSETQLGATSSISNNNNNSSSNNHNSSSPPASPSQVPSLKSPLNRSKEVDVRAHPVKQELSNSSSNVRSSGGFDIDSIFDASVDELLSTFENQTFS